MLVEFRAKNFRSIRGDLILSMVASPDTTHEQNCIDAGADLKLLRAAAIYGPNASGKSNIIKAMEAMRKVVLSSYLAPPGKGLAQYEPFLFDKESGDEPTEFEVTYIESGGKRYQYGFSYTAATVVEEWLFSYETARARTLFQRSFDNVASQYDWKWGSTFKGEKERLRANTRQDSLFVSSGAQLNHPILTGVYQWFRDFFLDMQGGESLAITAQRIKDLDGRKDIPEDLQALYTRWLRTADPHINGIVVEPVDEDELAQKVILPDTVTESEHEQLLRFVSAKWGYNVELTHPVGDTGKIAQLSLDEESQGTQRFFRLLGPLSDMISHGISVYVDEIEASLHPLLTRHLVQFANRCSMSSKAQLIFTTHDTTLLDPSLLRRDQVWFTEKNDFGATTLRPLSDFKGVRKDEALQKGYLSGRYGAIPIFESFEEFNEV